MPTPKPWNTGSDANGMLYGVLLAGASADTPTHKRGSLARFSKLFEGVLTFVGHREPGKVREPIGVVTRAWGTTTGKVYGNVRLDLSSVQSRRLFESIRNGTNRLAMSPDYRADGKRLAEGRLAVTKPTVVISCDLVESPAHGCDLFGKPVPTTKPTKPRERSKPMPKPITPPKRPAAILERKGTRPMKTVSLRGYTPLEFADGSRPVTLHESRGRATRPQIQTSRQFVDDLTGKPPPADPKRAVSVKAFVESLTGDGGYAKRHQAKASALARQRDAASRKVVALREAQLRRQLNSPDSLDRLAALLNVSRFPHDTKESIRRRAGLN